MNLQDLTTDDMTMAVRRALVAEYGDTYWVYPVTFKPLTDPMTAIYSRGNGTYRRTVTFDLAGDLPVATLGTEEVEVEQHTVYLDVPANFSAETTDADEMVEWTGTVFRPGDYGRKGKYDRTHLDRFVSLFGAEGVPIKDSHIEETFFGKCLEDHDARVSRIWVNEDGSKLEGTFRAPKWAADAAKKRVKSVSIGLTDDRQAIREVSLVLNPHVGDAAVFEHDLARAIIAAPTFSAFAAAHPDDARLVTQAAKAEDPAPAHAGPKRNPTMNFREKTQAAFALLTPAQREQIGLTQTEIDDTANFAAPTPDPRDTALARAKAESILSGLKASGRGVPDAPFFALCVPAIKRDGGGRVTFSDDGVVTTGDAVKALVTLCEAIPSKVTGRERLPAAEFGAAGESKTISEEERFAAALEGRAPVAGK